MNIRVTSTYMHAVQERLRWEFCIMVSFQRNFAKMAAKMEYKSEIIYYLDITTYFVNIYILCVVFDSVIYTLRTSQ